ncbi:MAG: OmpH family outer membrane protein, partial [Rhodospirillales bacterium]
MTKRKYSASILVHVFRKSPVIYAYSRCLVLTACLFFAVSPVAMAAEQGPTRIGVAIVDLEQVRAKSSAYKNVVEQLRTYQNELNGELQKEEESLRQANMELARKRTLISPEAFNEERRKVEESQAKLRSSVQGKQREMQKMEAGALTALEASILEVIARISKDHGFNLI